MKAEFKQKNKKLFLEIEAVTLIEKTMLEEFMQQQISGFKHSFNYQYTKENNNLSIHFRPTIGGRNLLKDGWGQLSTKKDIDWLDNETYGILRDFGNPSCIFFKIFKNTKVLVNTFGSVWFEKPAFLNNPESVPELIHKRVNDMEELRDYVRENEIIWRSY
jgi:hypothetical protein